jgi:hypothetical protein
MRLYSILAAAMLLLAADLAQASCGSGISLCTANTASSIEMGVAPGLRLGERVAFGPVNPGLKVRAREQDSGELVEPEITPSRILFASPGLRYPLERNTKVAGAGLRR